MAFDGVVISNVVSDLKKKLVDGRIYKIYQPENDELNIIIKNNRENYRLLLSADASLPLIYLLQVPKENPMTAPNFCMLLRKHIGNGRIVDVCQPGFERIVEFTIEHLDEMGDLCRKKLIIEIMGKHSNIIFTDADGMIIDSIKHISHLVSSVREVLPGKAYVYPPSGDKRPPYDADRDYFISTVYTKPVTVTKAIYSSVTGISPLIANELCYRAGIDGGQSTAALTDIQKEKLYQEFEKLFSDINTENYVPNIVYDGYVPVEFSSVRLSMYQDYQAEDKDEISKVLDEYYFKKSKVTRIRQKSADLRKIISTAIERTSKKYDLQLKQMKDTEDREKYKVYGELINTYGYGVAQGAKSFHALNYYTNEEITIPLDPTMTPAENSKKYFDKYGKLKRTEEALTEQIADTRSEIEHLESVSNALDIALAESDLAQIKEELMEYGYIKKHYDRRKGQKAQSKSKPFHYVTEDGYDIYVGKNNFQNDELTFKFATGNDWWFHAKKMAGSHVVVKSKDGELPDHIFEIAGQLAAYYSKGRTAPKVEIDYIQKKQVKKPAGAKPGFVVYYTNYSLMAEPSLKGVREV